MLIYNVHNTLMIHAPHIITSGRIIIQRADGKMLREIPMENTDFLSIAVDLPEGKYLIICYVGKHIHKKRIRF